MMWSMIDFMSNADLIVGVIGGITVIVTIFDRASLNGKHIVFLEKIIDLVLYAMVILSVINGILIIIRIMTDTL